MRVVATHPTIQGFIKNTLQLPFDAEKVLDNICSEWELKVGGDLLEKLLLTSSGRKSGYDKEGANNLLKGKGAPLHPDLSILKLATSYFVRSSDDRVVYVTDGSQDELNTNPETLARGDPSMDHIASKLVQIVGGDPRLMTAQDMDSIDARFLCSCTDQEYTLSSGCEPTLIRSWRNAVSNRYLPGTRFLTRTIGRVAHI